MKTENLWAPILIHLLNNSIAPIVGDLYGIVFTFKTLLYEILFNVILFLPFLLTKEYRSNKNDKEVYLDN